MKDSNTYDGDWIAAWIARQREILQARQSAPAGGTNAADWIESGKAFFEGLRGSASAKPEGLDPFNIGDAMLNAWSSATAFQTSAAEQVSEALGRLPPIGLAREHTEAWRELVAAHLECKRIEQELRAVLAQVQVEALELLEKRVSGHGSAPPEDFRALYDLWVECGEQAFSKLAHSASYSKLQAELGNASMRLRSRVQVVLEQALKQFDLPTRSELNSVHRQMRELRMEIERLTADQHSQPLSPASRKARARKPAAPQSKVFKPVSRKAKARPR